MSIEKLKVSKKSKNIDTYSRNPIINNLIRNKLQTEIVNVKQSVKNIIQRQSSEKNIGTKTQGKFRRQKSYTLTPKMINESLQYDPVQRVRNYIQQFIASRQIQSYLIPKEQIYGVNQARQKSGSLTVKFNKSDQLNYQAQDNPIKKSNRIKLQVIKQFKADAWIPQKPEIEHMVQDRLQMITEQNTSPKGIFDNEKIAEESKKFKNDLLTPLSSSSSSRLQILKPPLSSLSHSSKKKAEILQPVDYTFNRYHKQDYKSLQIWLQKSLQKVAKTEQYQQLDSSSITLMLDTIYGLYMATWKQIIRLTYIQSYEKALITEKIFYSTLRLFNNIISQQHTTAREYQKQRQSQMQTVNKMLEHRCQQLNKKFEQNNFETKELKQKNYRLSLTYIAYQKINRQLMLEVQKLNHQKKKHEEDLSHLNKAYVKALQILYDKNLIQMEYDKQQQRKKGDKKSNKITYRTFYMVGKDNKPMILGRFKYFEGGNSQFANFEDQLQSINSGQFSRYGKQIQELQNQINRYWSKKQDDLEIKGIVNSCLINVKIQDYGTCTIDAQPIDFGCQFPENSSNYIEKLLNQQKQSLQKQFKIELSSLQTQLRQKDVLLQKWISSNQGNVQKIKSLQQTIQNIQQTLKKQKKANAQINNQLKQSSNLTLDQQKQIQELEKDKKSLQTQIQMLKNKNIKIQTQMEKINKQYLREKQNINMMVRANLQAKQAAEKQRIRHDTIKKKITDVAPYLEKLVAEIERLKKDADEGEQGRPADLSLLITVEQKIQEHLGDYVVRDSGLFMTKI